MEAQTAYYIAAIVGTFVAIGLTVNAYFIRSLLESLNQVKEQTAVLIERSIYKEKRLDHLEQEMDDLKEKYHRLAGMVQPH